MKNLIIFFFVISYSILLHSQEFSFTLYFEDALGNKDSIIIGYDSMGTKGIDTVFKEDNIIDKAYSENFEIRIGNEWMKNNLNINPSIDFYETKKQITIETCNSSDFWTIFPLIEIHFLCRNYPIKVSWNKLLFNDECRNGSVLTGVHPGGWWDVAGYRFDMLKRDTALLEEHDLRYAANDSIYVGWFIFADSSLLKVNVDEINEDGKDVLIYPNPCYENLYINSPSIIGDLDIEIINSIGELILIEKNMNPINLMELLPGIYFLKIKKRNTYYKTILFRKI